MTARASVRQIGSNGGVVGQAAEQDKQGCGERGTYKRV